MKKLQRKALVGALVGVLAGVIQYGSMVVQAAEVVKSPTDCKRV